MLIININIWNISYYLGKFQIINSDYMFDFLRIVLLKQHSLNEAINYLQPVFAIGLNCLKIYDLQSETMFQWPESTISDFRTNLHERNALHLLVLTSFQRHLLEGDVWSAAGNIAWKINALCCDIILLAWFLHVYKCHIPQWIIHFCCSLFGAPFTQLEILDNIKWSVCNFIGFGFILRLQSIASTCIFIVFPINISRQLF